MDILKKILNNLVNEKKTLLLIEIGIIMILAFLFCGNKEESIVIYYDEYPNDMDTQIFFDIGNGYSEEHSARCRASRHTKIVLPSEDILSLKAMRMDFSTKEGLLIVNKMVLCKNGIPVLKLDAIEIREILVDVHGLKCRIENNRLIIDCLSSDTYCCFNEVIVNKIKEIYKIVQPIEVAASLAFLCMLSLVFYFREYIYIWVCNMSQRKRFTLALILFTLCVLWCYREYILGNVVFIFNGIACDSYAQTYPNLYRIAYLIENGKNIFGLDFTRGYGAARGLSAINIFDWMVFWGTENLEYLMGISQIFKIILSFVLFYFYLKLIKRKELSSYIGAASYALCGHMLLRQYWKSYPNEVVLSAFLLIALEYSISRKKRVLLPIAVSLYCISLGDYMSIYILGLIIGYSIFRYLELYSSDLKGLLSAVLYNVSAYILAFLVSFVFFGQSLVGSISSDRAQKGVTLFDIDKLFQLQDFDTIKCAIIRTVGIALDEQRKIFYGLSNNILDGPTFYCGIVILLFIPFAICMLKGKRKILAYVVTAIVSAYIVFPNIRFIANGFSSFSYKLSSFWIITIILYYGTMGIDAWIDGDSEKRFSIYIFHLLVAVTSLLLISGESGTASFNSHQLIILIGIIILVDITITFRDKLRTYHMVYVIIMLSYIDLLSNACVLARTGIALTENKITQVYTDNSINYIKEKDKSGFYRIDDKDNRTQINTGLVLDYNGFVDYSGGTSMNDNVHHFLNAMHIAKIEPSSNHYMTGLTNANELYDILSAKYILTSAEAIDNDYGLKLLTEIDGKKIYENNNVLPIGFCYYSCFNEEDLEELTIQERRTALLDSCVLNSDIAAEAGNIINTNSQTYKIDIEGEKLAWEYDPNTKTVFFNEVPSDKVIVLTFDMDTKRDYFDILGYGNSDGQLGTVSVGSEDAHSSQSFVFTGSNISYFQNQVDMSDIEITVYDRREYYAKSDQYLQDRKNGAFECTSFSSNHIVGSVNSEKDAVLYFSIPYDKGWNIYIDGEKADLLKVNYGFIGAYMEAGKHDIVLQYQTPYLKISIIISIIGVVLIVVWCIFWHRKEENQTYGRKQKNVQNFSGSTSL